MELLHKVADLDYIIAVNVMLHSGRYLFQQRWRAYPYPALPYPSSNGVPFLQPLANGRSESAYGYAAGDTFKRSLDEVCSSVSSRKKAPA